MRFFSIVSVLFAAGCASAPLPDERRSETWSERVSAVAVPAVLRIISDNGNVGSGFVIHPSGLAVTNAHVVGDVVEGFADSSLGPCRYSVVFAAPSRDLALLQLQAQSPLPSLRLGDSRTLALGAPVLAAGAPQGMFPVVTVGVFGGRSIPGMIADNLVPELLIHGAPTLRGSSGCPVLGANGLVIGVQAAKPGQEVVLARPAEDEVGRRFDQDLGRHVFQTEAFGLAVPVEDLIELGPHWVGPELASGLETGFQAVMNGGSVEIHSVSDIGPAYEAGLRVGDRLVAARGQEVLSTIDLALKLADPSPLMLSVDREGRQLDLSLERVALPAPAREALTPGVSWALSPSRLHRVSGGIEGPVHRSGLTDTLRLPSELVGGDDFSIELFAWLDVPVAGSWLFELGSDDGSQLFIQDRLVVDNDGLHAHKSSVGLIELAAGLHPVRVLFFEAGGQESLEVRWAPEGSPLESIAPELLWRSGG
ncbi:MAG: trypsin-like peptidase domain-containing protein [Planctomycetes bacterium]|nr:trypsin-like peptidase domain-containing protein [Planctomycetota bacterium]